MRFQLRTLLVVSAILPLVVGVGWNLPAIGLATNCGGNNAARAHVSGIAIMLWMFAEKNPAKQFNLGSAKIEERRELTSYPLGWGVTSSDIAISMEPIHADCEPNRRIIVVCTRPFTNVPQYMFRRAPPSHAVAYSDGSVKLISAREFEALDLKSFVRLNEIRP
jgi:hypothetical protein